MFCYLKTFNYHKKNLYKNIILWYKEHQISDWIMKYYILIFLVILSVKIKLSCLMRETVLEILSRYLNIYFSGKRSLHVAIIYTGRLIFPMWVCLHVQDDKWYEPYNKVCSMCVLSFHVDRQLRPQNWRRKKMDIPHVRHLNMNLMRFRTPHPRDKKIEINETTLFCITIEKKQKSLYNIVFSFPTYFFTEHNNQMRQ